MEVKFTNSVAGIDVPAIGGRRFVNLDNAASTPPFKSVLQAVNDLAPWYSSVHRGTGIKSRLSTDLYEQARQTVASFVGANPDQHTVIFGKNTTEAINQLAQQLPLRKRDVVIISHLEHHSNDLPWRARATVRRIAMTPEGGVDQQDFIKLLQRHRGRVKLVAITGASNVTGHMPDIHWFAARAHAAGAQILVDCAQLAAHQPISMGSLHNPEHLDYVALSAHKMYAPFGTGALIARRDMFEQGQPGYTGGGTILFVTERTVDWAPPPDRDEAGSPNVVGAVALARTIQTFQDLGGVAKIAAYEADLTAYALECLQNIPGIVLYGDTDPAHTHERSGIIPFNVRGLAHGLVAAALGYEWNIAVRSGCFCAHPYVMSLLKLDKQAVVRARRKVIDNQRWDMPGMVRISIGLYNTRDDIDRLVEALTAITVGAFGDYLPDGTTGMYVPHEGTPTADANVQDTQDRIMGRPPNTVNDTSKQHVA